MKVGGITTEGYVDLGRQCTLLQRSEAKRLGINWSVGELPVLRGLGNNVVVPTGITNLEIEINNIAERVDAYIAEDNVIKYPVLIGHSYPEQPGIIITKTTDALIFNREVTSKLRLTLKEDVSVFR